MTDINWDKDEKMYTLHFSWREGGYKVLTHVSYRFHRLSGHRDKEVQVFVKIRPPEMLPDKDGAYLPLNEGIYKIMSDDMGPPDNPDNIIVLPKNSSRKYADGIFPITEARILWYELKELGFERIAA